MGAAAGGESLASSCVPAILLHAFLFYDCTYSMPSTSLRTDDMCSLGGNLMKNHR